MSTEVGALLARMAVGDEHALAELYDRLSPLAYGLALRIVREQDGAEDVVQEAFLRVWHRAEQFDPARGAPKPWFLRIVRNLAIDRVRQREAQARVERESGVDPGAEVAPERPDELAVRAERATLVRRALATLSVQQRRLLECAYFEGLSHSEIAAREATPLGTVKTRIRDGVQKLRAHLAGVWSHA